MLQSRFALVIGRFALGRHTMGAQHNRKGNVGSRVRVEKNKKHQAQEDPENSDKFEVRFISCIVN